MFDQCKGMDDRDRGDLSEYINSLAYYYNDTIEFIEKSLDNSVMKHKLSVYNDQTENVSWK
jgi:hypothetical protein